MPSRAPRGVEHLTGLSRSQPILLGLWHKSDVDDLFEQCLTKRHRTSSQLSLAALSAAAVPVSFGRFPMLRHIRIQNFKALRDLSLDLTPVHLLIGPNDSGKTSILDALTALCRSVDHEISHTFTGNWTGRQLVWHGNESLKVGFEACIESDENRFQYGVSFEFSRDGREISIADEYVVPPNETSKFKIEKTHPQFTSVCHLTRTSSRSPSSDSHRFAWMVQDALIGVHCYRWSPRILSMPVAPDSNRRFQIDQNGFGLALCLDEILGFDRVRFDNLEMRFKKIFPQISSIKLVSEPAFRGPADDLQNIPLFQRAEGKGLYFQFRDSEHLVPASQVSDGVILVLAYLTVLYLPTPPHVLLVEEPENGVHPKRLQELVNIIRDLVTEQKETQVILTTHSPYVVDLFEPNEVTLCSKETDGSVSVHRLSESESVRKQMKFFTLGEIWTSEGDDQLATQDNDHEHEQP